MAVEDHNARKDIESYAWDATVGAGNDSEIVNFKRLAVRLGREPTPLEMAWFSEAWQRCLQDLAQL